MVQELDKSNFFKGIVCDPADNTEKTKQVIQDMIDTMFYYLKKDREEGFAICANMIGVNKRIIIINEGEFRSILINPVVIDKTEFLTPEEIETERLRAERETTDFIFGNIALEYYDENWEKQRKLFRRKYGTIKQMLDRIDGIF